MTRFQKFAMVLLGVLVVLSAWVLLSIEKASAEPILPACDPTYLETWDWPFRIRQPTNGSPTGAGITNFDPENDSYIIVQRKTSYDANPKRRIYHFYRYSNTDRRLILYDDAGVPKVRISGTTGSPSLNNNATLQSEPRNLVSPPYYIPPTNTPEIEVNPNSSTTTPLSLDGSLVHCVVVAHNVIYDGSWQWNKFVGSVDWSEGSGINVLCTTLDIACHINKVFSAVGDTLKEIAKSGLRLFANLFVPDGAQVQADFEEFEDAMTAKLGFLAYPVTFMVDVFEAFTATGSGTCTTEGCVKSFGNLFGGGFSIDFASVAVNFPSLWSWLCGFLIGLTILELIIMIRKKALGVIHK